jgi:hypothetical protein
MQAAAVAARALMDAAVHITEPAQSGQALHYLRILEHDITAMISAYQPAELVVKEIQSFLDKLVP